MKELTPEEMKQISGGLMRTGPLAALFEQLGQILNNVFPSKKD